MKQNFLNFEDELFDKGIENINYVVENCNVNFEFDNFKFPKYELPEGTSEEQYIRKLVYEGAALKYMGKHIEENADNVTEENEKKIKKEL